MMTDEEIYLAKRKIQLDTIRQQETLNKRHGDFYKDIGEMAKRKEKGNKRWVIKALLAIITLAIGLPLAKFLSGQCATEVAQILIAGVVGLVIGRIIVFIAIIGE